MTGTEEPTSFRLLYVPGVTPTKWARIWHERLPDVALTLVSMPAADAAEALRDGGADVGLVRLPVDQADLSAIPLYTETTVVVVPKDHDVAAVEEVSVEDLAGYVVLHPLDDSLEWEGLPGVPAKERPATTADAVELVAAGVGLLVVPQSLARLYHRRDLTYRPVANAPESRIALSWLKDQTTDLVDEFIGIVRGRTVNSSRGRTTPTPPVTPPTKQNRAAPGGGARQKAASGRSSSGRSGSGGSGGGSGGGARSGAGAPRSGKPRRRS